MTSFNITVDDLHQLVNDSEQGPRMLKELGGASGLARQLRTHLSTGLEAESAEQREARTEAFSTNELPPAEQVTFVDLVMESLEDRMMQVLIVSAVISLVLGLTVADSVTGVVDYAHGWIEGAAILLSVALVTLVSSLNNYQKERKFVELTKATPPVKVSVIRAGRATEMSDKELLVGDLLNVTGGDVLSVDGVVVRSNVLKVDESAATGENDEITKTVKGDCFLRSGSYVVEGEGTVLVTGVGVNSFAGRITMQVRGAAEETPLQEKLTALADLIGYFGMAAAALMFVTLSGKELYDTVVRRRHPWSYKRYLDNLTTAVTIVVVAVPEGLPLSVTIALAYSMKQMFFENNLVRHLAACETMGGATTICTDKTGTITQNEMTVTDGVTSSGIPFVVPAAGDTTAAAAAGKDGARPFEAVLGTGQPHAAEVRRLLMEGIAVNTKASRRRVEDPTTKKSSVRLTGNKTEQAMLAFVERLGEDPMALRAGVLASLQDKSVASPSSPNSAGVTPWPELNAQSAAYTKEVFVYPFSSARKRMTTAIALRKEGVVRYHVKGASELVLEDCDHVYNDAGVREPMRHETRQRLQEMIMAMARRRLRTLAVACVDRELDSSADTVEFPETDTEVRHLTLLAIVGMRDPVRPEVPHAIARCCHAGVVVRMITGDNKATAISIAKEVGIYGTVQLGPARGEQGLALEGPQFRAIAQSQRKLNALLPRLQVISRASPLDKQVLVAALMARGEVVAVTGDGTNDAPALKNANVGFSMRSGTEVAKNASDVIILDDNFSTIVTAIKWGRNVNANIAKFLQFQMTVNIAAVVVSFLGALFDGAGQSPLKPVQLLWLNLIMDSLAALALATEAPTDAVLNEPPKPKQAPLISRRMWANIAGQSVYQVLLQLWLLQRGHRFFGVPRDSEEHLSIVFNVFVLLQLSNEFNARLLDNTRFVFAGVTRAPLFLLVVGATFVVQILGVQHGGALMRCVPLSSAAWIRCFALALVPLPLGLLLRMIDIPEAPVPPALPVVDEDEEAALEASQRARRRPTLRCAARQVIVQLRVVAAFTEAVRERTKKA